jgi:hypothetical protein
LFVSEKVGLLEEQRGRGGKGGTTQADMTTRRGKDLRQGHQRRFERKDAPEQGLSRGITSG